MKAPSIQVGPTTMVEHLVPGASRNLAMHQPTTNGPVYLGLFHQNHNVQPETSTATFSDFVVTDFDDSLINLPPPGEEAMELAMGNWNARVIGVAETVDSHTIARDVIANTGNYTVNVDASDMRNRIDMAGGGGSFPHNHVYPDGTTAPDNGDDFVVHATTKAGFFFPEGEYSLAFGSDDGGQIALDGATFVAEFNSDDDGDDSVAFFNGNRGQCLDWWTHYRRTRRSRHQHRRVDARTWRWRFV